MSLIDEALKRARMEAAQRAAEQEGLPYPAIPRHRPVRRRSWPLAGAVVLAAAVGIAAGLWLAGREEPAASLAALPEAPAKTAVETPPASGTPASPAVSEAAPTEAVAPTSLRSLATLPPDGPAAAAASSDPPAFPPAPSPPAAAQPPPTATPEKPPIAAARPAPPAGSTTSRAAPAAAPITDPDSGVLLVLPEGRATPPAGSADDGGAPPEESYRQQYELPGGGTIELGGIAWSETGPFALINGRVVGPGSAVEEFTLERIGPEHVILSAAGRRIRIDLR